MNGTYLQAHGDTLEGKWKGNWRMEWVLSTLHTTSEHGLSSITTADAHTSAASSRLNWRPCGFKWTRLFRRKTKSGFCVCAITFQTQPTLLSTAKDQTETIGTGFEPQRGEKDFLFSVPVQIGTRDQLNLLYEGNRGSFLGVNRPRCDMRQTGVLVEENQNVIEVLARLCWHLLTCNKRGSNKLDVCMTVDHTHNNINNQLDATITVY